jgi:hypothetical protein
MELISPIGRFVQGSLSLEVKNDPTTNKPKLDDQGQPIKECFIALAIRKDDPGLPAFYQAIVQQARADFPTLFDANGNCVHPQFAWKIQDGDGVDQSGKSVKDKPGFAGHFIFKLGTQFLPKCYHAGKYDPTQMIQNPHEVIKRGYYIRVNLQVRGNGVTVADRTKKPGMFLSPNLVELVAYGEEIVGGPDAAKVFGAAPTPTQLPPGASMTPVGAPAATQMPPMPGRMPALPGAPVAAPVAPAALPPMHPAMPMATGLPPIGGPAVGLPVPHLTPPVPMAPAAPVYQMQPSAMGASREALIAQGWTDELLLQHGHMVRIG